MLIFLFAAILLVPSVSLAQSDGARIPLRMTIETTPETIVVTKRPRLQPADRASATEVRVMQDPPNNFRHTCIYRRETQAAAR